MTYTGKIILNLQGTPIKHNATILPNSHGYYAYVNSNDQFIHTLFRDLCMWGNHTETYTHYTEEGNPVYLQYEIPCNISSFIRSDAFTRICNRHNVAVIISDDNDMTAIRDFFKNTKNSAGW